MAFLCFLGDPVATKPGRLAAHMYSAKRSLAPEAYRAVGLADSEFCTEAIFAGAARIGGSALSETCGSTLFAINGGQRHAQARMRLARAALELAL